MRLSNDQIQAIRQLSQQIAGVESRVRVFGSRLDGTAPNLKRLPIHDIAFKEGELL